MNKFIPCRKCAKKKGPSPGFFYVQNKDQLYVSECSCHKEWVERENRNRKLKEANLWDSEYSISNYVGNKSQEDALALKTYIDNFEEKFKDKMIYMYGLNSCQKTTLAMWVGKSLLDKDFSVYYTLMESLSVALLPDFNAEKVQMAEKEKIIDKAMNSDLLIIDESFDKSKLTLYKSGYQIPFIDRFIRERFELKNKAIIFISNKKPEEIESQGFGQSLQSLIVRNVKKSTLYFLDKYVENCNYIDRKGLFE